MATSTGESLEKMEDMIVRAAETTAANMRAAKEAIGNVIFGQDKVIEQALITVLCGGHALLTWKEFLWSSSASNGGVRTTIADSPLPASISTCHSTFPNS